MSPAIAMTGSGPPPPLGIVVVVVDGAVVVLGGTVVVAGPVVVVGAVVTVVLQLGIDHGSDGAGHREAQIAVDSRGAVDAKVTRSVVGRRARGVDIRVGVGMHRRAGRRARAGATERKRREGTREQGAGNERDRD